MLEIMDGMSMNLEQANMDKLRSVFPECFSEGKLDIDKLLALCGEYISNDFEKYRFEWKGKAECLKLAQKRSTGTLRPCPEESVNWDSTQNLYIEGDNLEVLKLLQTAYYRRVKMIYIDPPYNTGNDFVYADDFADPMARYKEVTQQTTKSNPETMGRFHTNWLNMMYPRLRLAANLLRDDGVIFISIDDAELYNLKKICDEVFGEEYFRGQITRVTGTPTGQGNEKLVSEADYILLYSKSANFTLNGLPFSQEDEKIYNLEDEYGKYLNRPLRKTGGEDRREDRPSMYYPVYSPDGTPVYPIAPSGYESRWRCGEEHYKELCEQHRIAWVKDGDGWKVYQKFYLEGRTKQASNLWDGIEGNKKATITIKQLLGTAAFDFPKPVELLERAILLGTNENDIILDFFSGSATTAHAVMQLNAKDGGNRKFILVQLPEFCDEKSEAYKAGYKNICEIGKERIRRAGAKLIQEQAEKDKPTMDGQITIDDNPETHILHSKLDIGFRVFKLDTSNMETWDGTPITNDQLQILYDRMNSMVQRVKPDRTDLDMVFEVMLKLGVPLTYSVNQIAINNKTAYTVGDDCLLLICLATDIAPEDVEAMAEYAPAKVIISRDSFTNDTAMANAYYILRDRGIELKLV